MGPRVKEARFRSEADLCAAFIAWATDQGVKCFAEWWGWDVLVVFGDGAQLGIQAKLRFNADVILQAAPSRWGLECEDPGPDFRGVLVPDLSRVMGSLAEHVGVEVFSSGDLQPVQAVAPGPPWVDGLEPAGAPPATAGEHRLRRRLAVPGHADDLEARRGGGPRRAGDARDDHDEAHAGAGRQPVALALRVLAHAR